ncbi:MAG TPA: hypothetical protein VNO21_00145 [Polyangiaceae bacterium]|nr:hypothetical protein [Polyangiaceae bacterium]
MTRTAMGVLLIGSVLAACGGKGGPATQFPPREEGCAVALEHAAPAHPTVNIGPVSANCDESVSEADCLRTLKDQVCKLGGDIAWGVAEEPVRKNSRQQWSGRAAHTK